MLQGLARNWWVIALRGVIAILFGAFTIMNPGLSLAALVLLFGAYALVDGVFAVIAALTRRDEEPRWVALLLSGIVGIAIGILTFVMPALTAVAVLYLIAAWAVVRGIFEIAAAIRLRKAIRGELWLILAGVLSVLFGILLFARPGAGALALLLWIGVFAIVLGVFLVLLAFRIRGWGKALDRRSTATT